jgi:AcrR family transcriptional regulator
MSSAPTPTPRTKPARERRADLLDAAQEIVAQRGAAALTVGEVTTRAGVAKGTFYLQFKTKDDVLVALRERIGSEILAEHERSLAELPGDDHRARLERWLADAIHGRLRRAELHDALFHHHNGSIRTGVGSADPHIAMLAALLRDGVAAGAFDLDDPGTTAVLLYSAMHGAVDALVRRGGDPAPLITATQELARRATLAPTP